MRFTSKITGDEDAARNVLNIGKRARDPRPATKAAAEILQRGVKSNFESQGSDFGEPWAPNAAATQRRKGGGAVLEDSGRLARAAKGGAGKRKRSSKRGAMAGVGGKSLFYARFAQAGTEKHGKRGSAQPPRRIVGVSKGDRALITHLVNAYVKDEGLL